MKKLIAVILALLALFAFVACDEQINNENGTDNSTATSQPNDATNDKGSSGNVGGSNSGNGGSNGGNSGIGDGGLSLDNLLGNLESSPSISSGDGLKLTNALVSQFEKAQSMKVNVDMDIEAKIDSWSYDTDNDNEAVNANHSLLVDAKFVMTIAKTENGYDTKVEAQLSANADGIAMTYNGPIAFVIDGILYQYNMSEDVYEKSEDAQVDTTELEAIIGELFAGLNLSNEDKDKLLNILGGTVLDAFDVSFNRGSISIDAKPIINKTLNYIKNLDLNNDTLGDVINDALALADKDLTIEKLLEGTENVCNLTVEQFLEIIENALVEECGMGIQDIYNMIVNSTEFQAMLTGMIASGDMSEEEIAKLLETMKNTKIKELIPQEIMSQTVYTVMMEAVKAGSESETGEEFTYPTSKQFFLALELALSMPLANAEEEFEIPFSAIKELANGIDVDELNYKCEVEFSGLFKLSSYKEELKADFSLNIPSQVAGKTNYLKLDASIITIMGSISDQKVSIALPEDARIVASWPNQY